MDWMPVSLAPRDGRKVRVKDDEGRIYVAEFRYPHWWLLGGGAARLADGDLYTGDVDIARVLEWQHHSPPDSIEDGR